jgi:hypothetical protein
MPSTLASQHWAVSKPDEQRGERSSTIGDAVAMSAKSVTMTAENCMLLDGGGIKSCVVDEVICVVV